jgi:hypothetical protein
MRWEHMAAKQEVYALKLHAYWVHITFFQLEYNFELAASGERCFGLLIIFVL